MRCFDLLETQCFGQCIIIADFACLKEYTEGFPGVEGGALGAQSVDLVHHSATLVAGLDTVTGVWSMVVAHVRRVVFASNLHVQHNPAQLSSQKRVPSACTVPCIGETGGRSRGWQQLPGHPAAP